MSDYDETNMTHPLHIVVLEHWHGKEHVPLRPRLWKLGKTSMRLMQTDYGDTGARRIMLKRFECRLLQAHILITGRELLSTLVAVMMADIGIV
jgi:hypothetical protein